MKQIFPILYNWFFSVLVDKFLHRMGHFETHLKTMDIDDQLRSQYMCWLVYQSTVHYDKLHNKYFDIFYPYYAQWNNLLDAFESIQ